MCLQELSATPVKGKFLCQSKSLRAPSATNKNAHITEPLEKLLQVYTSTNNKWRMKAYSTVIGALKRHPTRITSEKDLDGIRGVGSKMRESVRAILFLFIPLNFYSD